MNSNECERTRTGEYMSHKTYLWIEDRKNKAGYIFGENFMRQLCPNVTVVSKNNNSELVKAVKFLEDDDNKYVIVYDNSFDNPQVIMELKWLTEYIAEKDNVFLVDIICFEYILLEFENLITWIYAPDDEFLKKRSSAIAARKTLVDVISSGNINYKRIREIIEYDYNIDDHNIEQLAARLLFELTRNTGFEVSKGAIGECWFKSCCEWERRQEDDLCGLDYSRLSAFDKMKSIYEGTSLKEQLAKAGLEMLQ